MEEIAKSLGVVCVCVFTPVGAANLIALSIGNQSLGQSNAQPFELEGICMLVGGLNPSEKY